jgi:hypothetical protein
LGATPGCVQQLFYFHYKEGVQVRVLGAALVLTVYGLDGKIEI